MTEQRWHWLGDHLAVDLANTVIRRGRTMTELLNDPSDLAEWLELEKHRLAMPELVNDDLLPPFIALRDACLALLRAAVAGERLPTGAVAHVNELARAMPLPRLLCDSAGRSVMPAASFGDARRDVLATLAAAIVDLLGAPDLHQLAFCDAPSCGQFFHRQRANQTWCCPSCGDRVRVARHYGRAEGAR